MVIFLSENVAQF